MGVQCPRQMERTAFCTVITPGWMLQDPGPYLSNLTSEPQVYLDLLLLIRALIMMTSVKLFKSNCIRRWSNNT
jgi:hypothetical protein